LTNGNIVISGRKDEDGQRGNRAGDAGGGITGITTMKEALDRFESGIMMVSAIRHDAGCAERFACQLGQMARNSLGTQLGSDWEALMNAVNMAAPAGDKRVTNLTRWFERSARGLDDNAAGGGACQMPCKKCINL
jgi:hypothetical protein